VEFTQEALQENGFAGFVPLGESKTSGIPQVPGVYIVYRSTAAQPDFLPENKAVAVQLG
jgi:hypothetical protein